MTTPFLHNFRVFKLLTRVLADGELVGQGVHLSRVLGSEYTGTDSNKFFF